MSKALVLVFIIGLFVLAQPLKAQRVDSLYFNLYTDSLKIGTYNYINVDGKYSNGRYLPLTSKELIFTSNGGKFDGNSLFIDSSFSEPKVTVKVALKENPKICKEIIIYIKQSQEVERLRTVEEILGTPPKKKKKNEKS